MLEAHGRAAPSTAAIERMSSKGSDAACFVGVAEQMVEACAPAFNEPGWSCATSPPPSADPIASLRGVPGAPCMACAETSTSVWQFTSTRDSDVNHPQRSFNATEDRGAPLLVSGCRNHPGPRTSAIAQHVVGLIRHAVVSNASPSAINGPEDSLASLASTARAASTFQVDPR